MKQGLWTARIDSYSDRNPNIVRPIGVQGTAYTVLSYMILILSILYQPYLFASPIGLWHHWLMARQGLRAEVSVKIYIL